MKEYGYFRTTAVSPQVEVGNVAFNSAQHLWLIGKEINEQKSDLIVFPELSLTGYTCEDLFLQRSLQEDVLNTLNKITLESANWPTTVVVGAPIFVQEIGSLFNCAVVISSGVIQGIIPKTFLPNYREFYEARWFASASENDPSEICINPKNPKTRFGTDLLFSPKNTECVFGVEICEDVWSPIPPSTWQAVSGANVLVNLSASNETIGKSEYRREFVKSQSGKLAAAYIYCSSGPTESTKDLVFGGHNIIGENGSILEETPKFVREAKSLTCDIDLQRLQQERVTMPGTFGRCSQMNKKEFRKVEYKTPQVPKRNLLRKVTAHPFVPSGSELDLRCEEIFGVQTCGLAKRLEVASSKTVIGVSGGLDSTLALLVACQTYDMLGIDRDNITGITMPGFGTTNRTKTNADILLEELSITAKTVDIREQCVQLWKDMGHIPFKKTLIKFEDCDNVAPGFNFADLIGTIKHDALNGRNVHGLGKYHLDPKELTVELIEEALQYLPPNAEDLVFENVQARVRTLVLMSHGFVLGTGDLSELALGWCTYNGDHMSMYNVNCSIPKTLVKFLVKYIAENKVDETWGNQEKIAECLLDIVGTPISPELLPHKDGDIAQETEDSLGPYELHDFFLYNFMRCGFSPEKIMFLATHANFDKPYTIEEIGTCLKTFYKRFFSQQFKRDCVPNGPKVGSVSLSPRGDWRMPSDASSKAWLEKVDRWVLINKECNHEI